MRFRSPDLSIAPPNGRMIVPAAHYAVFTDPNGTTTLHNTWQYIWKQWLPACGLKPAPTPDFERYDERFNPATGRAPRSRSGSPSNAHKHLAHAIAHPPPLATNDPQPGSPPVPSDS